MAARPRPSDRPSRRQKYSQYTTIQRPAAGPCRQLYQENTSAIRRRRRTVQPRPQPWAPDKPRSGSISRTWASSYSTAEGDAERETLEERAELSSLIAQGVRSRESRRGPSIGRLAPAADASCAWCVGDFFAGIVSCSIRGGARDQASGAEHRTRNGSLAVAYLDAADRRCMGRSYTVPARPFPPREHA